MSNYSEVRTKSVTLSKVAAADRRQAEVERYMTDFREGVLFASAVWNLVDRRYVPMPSAARAGVFAGHEVFAAELEKQWPAEERTRAGR